MTNSGTWTHNVPEYFGFNNEPTQVAGFLANSEPQQPVASASNGTTGSGNNQPVVSDNPLPVAIPNLADDPGIAELVDVPEASVSDLALFGWRIEVTNRGRYFIWRKGSHKNRQSAPGGKFSRLSEERKNRYAQTVSGRKRN